MGLTKYRAKRHFQKTPEPQGRQARGTGFAFTVQRHHASHLHYDFRLELDGVLKSWAVPKGPSLDPAQRRLAVEVEDHPVEYGAFEGTIPKGQYGGGTVVLWERGTWTPVGDPHEGLRKGHLRFELSGHKLKGRWDLILMRGREDPSGKRNWLLLKVDDEFARPQRRYDITEARPESVAGAAARRAKKVWHSNRAPAKAARPATRRPKAKGRAPALDPSALTGALKAPLPEAVEPQLCTLVDAAPEGEEWVHEMKLDGYRLLAYIKDSRVTLRTRTGNDWTSQFPPIAASMADLPVREAVIDGEVVVLDEHGVSSFQALQNALSRQGRGQLVYYAFDLLHLDGYDVRRAPLLERKELLGRALKGAAANLRLSEHVQGGGAAFFQQACTLELEGCVSKRADSPYIGARTKQWLKAKCLRRQEFVVCGWTDPEGSRKGFGALILGLEEGGTLRYVGRVGTGFTQRELAAVMERLRPLEREDAPFPDPLPSAARRGAHWTQPVLVAEVAFGEWTDEGILRHPRYLGLREDKPAREVRRERPVPARKAVTEAARGGADSVAGVRLTNPGRVLYPEQQVTKLELARYYELVAEYALPHLTRRPLTLVRCPAGRQKHCFYQKHLAQDHPEALHGVPIEEGGTVRAYVYIEDLAGLVSLVQLGALELHPWGSTVDELERPDIMTFDLDPAPELEWRRIYDAARALRAKLQDLGLRSWLKTTGGKGLHLVVPLRPSADWDSVKAWSKALVELMVQEAPSLYTSKIAKSSRTGKIFLDYLRNGRGATAVGAYSTRARENAPVAAPLAWDELSAKKRVPQITVRTMARRLASLKADPWEGFFEADQGLK
jgi:bifunctional non-homologous end joining protein LigD